MLWIYIYIYIYVYILGCPEAIDLLNQPCRDWTVRKAVGKFWGNWSGRGLNLLPLAQRTSRCFFTSASLCAKTWVLPMELGGSWCYRSLWNQIDFPTPCKSSKLRLLDAEIIRGHRSPHSMYIAFLAIKLISSIGFLKNICIRLTEMSSVKLNEIRVANAW